MLGLPFGDYGYGISVLVISIMLSVSGIALGIGVATNNRRLKEFGKNEIVQSVVNGALVTSLLLLFSGSGIVGSLVTSLVVHNGTSVSCSAALSGNAAICFAYSYLVGSGPYAFMGHTNFSILTLSSTMLASVYLLYAALGTFSMFIGPLLSQLRYISQLLATLMIGATAQAAVLTFIAVSALTLLLPLGLVLRSFYPTRKMGAFLIALSIGLYVILPLTYVLDAGIVGSFGAISANSIDQVTLGANSIKSGILNSTIGINSTIETNSTILGQASLAYSLISPLLNAITSLITGVLNEIAALIVYAFVLPAFSLLITGISIRELSQLLGAEVPSFKLNLV